MGPGGGTGAARPAGPASDGGLLTPEGSLNADGLASDEAAAGDGNLVIAGGVAPGEASPQQRILLGMLAVGLTDEAIGRQLGWHPRTVQRHVRRLMSDLGAQTRFQAGLQAARRGWL